MTNPVGFFSRFCCTYLQHNTQNWWNFLLVSNVFFFWEIHLCLFFSLHLMSTSPILASHHLTKNKLHCAYWLWRDRDQLLKYYLLDCGIANVRVIETNNNNNKEKKEERKNLKRWLKAYHACYFLFPVQLLRVFLLLDCFFFPFFKKNWQ